MKRILSEDLTRRTLLVGVAGAAAAPSAAPLSGARFLLPARPESFAFEAARSAVLVVDMQNDFAAKGGLLDRQGVDISIIQKTIPPMERVLAVARVAGIKVIYLKMGFRRDLMDLGSQDSPTRVRNLQGGVGREPVPARFERERDGAGAAVCGAGRNLPAGRWQRVDSGPVAAVFEDRTDHLLNLRLMIYDLRFFRMPTSIVNHKS